MLRSHNKSIRDILGRDPIHPFPARMAPGIALDALAGQREPLRVLDPMVGSGTVLAVARARGHRAVGIDVDPLAVLLSRVWTATIDAAHIRNMGAAVLSRARRRFVSIPLSKAYPRRSDEETRAFARYWFDGRARRELTALAQSIAAIRDETARNALWCGFSRLIISKQSGASRAMDLSHSRPHRVFARAPVLPFERFEAAVDIVASNCPQRGSGLLGPPSLVKQGDARRLAIASGTIDLVLTSPPYLNAIDYMRCSKFALVWLGYTIGELRQIRSESVGTDVGSQCAAADARVAEIIKSLRLRPRLASRHERILAGYIHDMRVSVGEVARVLKPGGRAFYVVGDSTVRETFIRNSRVVVAVAEDHGLVLAERRARTLPPNRRYLPPPKRGSGSEALDGRMRQEVVLAFIKPASSV